MKRYALIIAGLGTATALASSAYVAAAASDEPARAGFERAMHPAAFQRAHARIPHSRGGFAAGRMGERLMETFDADKDGTVTQAEIDKARADQLAKYDANGDGKLSLAEYEKLWLDVMHERMVRAFQAHDADGDALVTTAEFQHRFAHTVARLDRNGDGVLSRDDFGRRGGDDRGGMRQRDDDDDGGRRGRRM